MNFRHASEVTTVRRNINSIVIIIIIIIIINKTLNTNDTGSFVVFVNP